MSLKLVEYAVLKYNMEEIPMSKKAVFFLLFCSLLVFNLCGVTMRHGIIAEAEAGSLKDVFKKVNPAVVVIVTKEGGYTRSISNFPIIGSRLGSGIVVSGDGLVMTAAHVVNVADEVSVYFLNGSRVLARVVSSAQQADVALLRLKEVPEGLKAVELGNSDLASIGDEVFVVGAPYGIDHTLTVGHLSGRRRTVGICDQLTPIELLQTDADINVGNSGGPLFDIEGRLIGIVSHILSKSGGSEGLGFAVSINTARALLIDQDTFWTGLEAYLVAGDLANALNVPQEAGLLVQRVAVGSIAFKTGIRPGKIPVKIGDSDLLIGGDILLAVQGKAISPDIQETCEIRESMGKMEKRGELIFRILRDGKILELKAPERNGD